MKEKLTNKRLVSHSLAAVSGSEPRITICHLGRKLALKPLWTLLVCRVGSDQTLSMSLWPTLCCSPLNYKDKCESLLCCELTLKYRRDHFTHLTHTGASSQTIFRQVMINFIPEMKTKADKQESPTSCRKNKKWETEPFAVVQIT